MPITNWKISHEDFDLAVEIAKRAKRELVGYPDSQRTILDTRWWGDQMSTALLCLLVCILVGVGVGFAERRVKHSAGLFYIWLAAILLLVVLGVAL